MAVRTTSHTRTGEAVIGKSSLYMQDAAAYFGQITQEALESVSD